MDEELERLMFDMNKVESLMVAIENTYLDITPVAEDAETAQNGGFAFYALWDAIHKVQQDLELLKRMNATSGDNQ